MANTPFPENIKVNDVIYKLNPNRTYMGLKQYCRYFSVINDNQLGNSLYTSAQAVQMNKTNKIITA